MRRPHPAPLLIILWLIIILAAHKAHASPAAIIIPAPPNAGTSNVVSESANYSLTGAETAVEVNASSASITITATPSAIAGLKPIRVKKIDASTNIVVITDGTNVCFVLVTPANSRGQLGGWADVSSNSGADRCEGTN